ncbi:cell division protein FtsA [Pseudomonas aeruginosa]|nr:cell division protein FtsA [Pseudomonas aeruginosa]
MREPLGMSGVRLEAKVHVVTCAVNASQNIEKCVRRCRPRGRRHHPEQLASAYSVLTEDEKELGVCLVDIGGGTTDIAIFTEGAIRHTAVIPIAGDQVTNDIATALRTPTQYAEEIKIRYACALAAGRCRRDHQGAQRRRSAAARICRARPWPKVVEPRYDELFTPGPGRAAPQRLRGPGSRPGSSSPAAPRRWKARSSWPRKSSTCRYASACLIA